MQVGGKDEEARYGGLIVGVEQLTERGRLALLAVCKLAGGRPGVTVTNDAVAAELGCSEAQAAARLATIPLAYVVDTYQGSRLTDAGVTLAEDVARQK